MHIGFIGTGNIASALVTGLCTLEIPRHGILVSPRNQGKSSGLAARFGNVRVASSNQAVVDASEFVVLALRPQIALEVLGGLNFREHHKILTLVAATPISAVRRAVFPATSVIRAVPLPSVARHAGPILLHPADDEVGAVLEGLGELFVTCDENQLSLLSVVTALISPFFALLDKVSRWAVRKGIEPGLADAYCVSMFQALCDQAAQSPQPSFAKMAEEAATPGGLNEQAHRLIAQLEGYQAFLKALEAVAARVTGALPADRD